jgi:hypothetical protein
MRAFLEPEVFDGGVLMGQAPGSVGRPHLELAARP